MGDEVRRRLVHAAGTAVPLPFLAGVVTWHQLRLIYVAGSVLAFSLEFLRLVVGLDWRVFRDLTREYEATNPAGYALYTVGSAGAVLAFEPRVAVPAVLMLTVADPVSGLLADNEFGETKRPAVLAVTFAVCLGLALPFVPPAVAAVGALVATAADGLTPVVGGYVLDDNLTIPVGAAVAMWAALGWVPATA